MKTLSCRLCEQPLSEPIFKLPNTPLANEFIETPTSQDLFPLEICCCDNCEHYQLSETVEPERLFRKYLYVAGTSPVNVEHFRQYALEMVERFKIKPGSLIIDIASNDGVLLRHFKDLGMRVLGIDPAMNLATEATKNGIPTIPEFFTEKLAEEIYFKHGEATLVTANNVIAHTDTIPEFMRGVKKLIGETGIFTFEVSYFKDVVEKLVFDTIYHEHVCYHTVFSLDKFFTSKNMTLFDVKSISNHGGSIRGYVGKNQSIYPNVAKMIKEEIKSKLHGSKKNNLKNFDKKINLLKDKLLKTLNKMKRDGLSIGIYGMPAKATTLMYTFGLTSELIDFAIDDAILKQGLYSPGQHIKVYSNLAIEEFKPDVLLILAWNFADSIIERNNFNGKWIIPLPKFKIITGEK